MEKKKRHEWVNGHLFTLFSHINYSIVTLRDRPQKLENDLVIVVIVFFFKTNEFQIFTID